MSAATGDTLDRIDVLKALDQGERTELAKQCGWRRYGAGEQIIARSSTARDAIFVVTGSVAIVNHAPNGREIAYATVREGGYFGELAAIDGEPRSATAVALEKCLVATMSPQVFRRLLLAHPEITIQIVERLARIIRTCDDRIMDLSTLSAVQRVCREVLRLSTPDPLNAGSWMIYPVPTQAQIAARASTTRETVARVLGQLGQDELVHRKGKTLYLRNKQALELLTEQLNSGSQGDAR
ncbi:Crp/Fnr family transcriptional regulator [Oceanibacterium hippocampi]|uniref:Crp/Fnr family transcriptional regulator n=1 Tax=Oceanibacterium hippocampi TaxID=745714 RepID=UPI00111C1F24|nr:Crp/Fnr family transcriptional regulator [Oceanibacterium hippocampi]